MTKPPADVARGDAAAHTGSAAEDGGNSCLRATQWKCSWLELRIACAPPRLPCMQFVPQPCRRFLVLHNMIPLRRELPACIQGPVLP